MEEKKQKPQGQEKIPYDRLKELARQLDEQNRMLIKQNQQMRKALEDRDFDYTSFFLSMLFKVMEHPEMYKSEFVSWSAEHIEAALMSFAASAFEDAGNSGDKPEGTVEQTDSADEA